MAYRFPPPPINKLSSETLSSPSVPVVNFSVPPPGFRLPCAVETWLTDTHHSCPPPPLPQPPIPLPAQEHSMLQPQEWGQVNAYMTADVLWLKDWLQRRRIGTHSHQKQPAVPLKVLISHTFISSCISCVSYCNCHFFSLGISFL